MKGYALLKQQLFYQIEQRKKERNQGCRDAGAGAACTPFSMTLYFISFHVRIWTSIGLSLGPIDRWTDGPTIGSLAWWNQPSKPFWTCRKSIVSMSEILNAQESKNDCKRAYLLRSTKFENETSYVKVLS